MSDLAISLRHVSKSFKVSRARPGAKGSPDPRRRRAGRRDFLDVLIDLNCEVRRGQTLGVVGVNGSGKTTLLKILAGVMEADAGSIQCEGRVAALLELGAGFHPDLTGQENIDLSASLLGLSRRQTHQYLADIIAFAELERFMDMQVKHFSTGMVVRLGFAIATQLQPDILLLDETFAVGDARFQTRALNRIRELHAAGATLVLVSHNAELLMELAERVIWLDRGRIALDGEPRLVLAAYRRECGAALSDSDRLRSQLIGEAVFLPVREGTSPIRIVEASIRSEGSPAGGKSSPLETSASGEQTPAAQSDAPLSLESRDSLFMTVGLEFDKEVDPARFQLQAWFKRDDSRVVACATVGLGTNPAGPETGSTPREALHENETVEPGDPKSSHGRLRRVQCEFTPVSLAHGEYEMILTIVRTEADRSGFVESRLVVPRKFRITTPLPHSFRLVADIPAQWVNGSSET